MNPNQIRIVDPILSQHARGYRQAGYVRRRLFPEAPVQTYGGQVIQFDKSSFRLFNTARAAGGATKRVQSFGYQGDPYFITERSLEGQVPFSKMRDASQVPGIDLQMRAVNTVRKIMELEQEYMAATLARNTATYDSNHQVALAGTSRWLGSASDPFGDVRNAREVIRQSCGLYPNTMILPPTGTSALDRNAVIRDRLKYTSSESVTTDMLARLFQIQNVVEAGAVMSTDQADDLGDVWGTDVILAYVSPGSDVNADIEEPSYGYSYLIEGMPVVEETYQDRNCKSWINPVTYDAKPQVAAQGAGFLIQGACGPTS